MNMKNYINLAKKHQLFFFLSMPALLIWMALGYMHSSLNSLNVPLIAQIIEWPINIINIILIIFILKKSRDKTENIGLLTSIAFLFLVDITYFIVYSLPQKRQYNFVFDVVHFTFYATTITFITHLLLNNALTFYKFSIALLFAIAIDIGIFALFSIEMRHLSSHGHSHISLKNNIQAAQSVLQFLIFSLAFLWLIYSRVLGSTLIAAGYLMLIASEFMIASCYMAKMFSLLVYGELWWLLSLILIMTGIIFIVTDKQYDVKKWMESGITIRTNLTFKIFSMLAISLVMFYVVLKEFSVINEKFYIFLPTIITGFTLIIAIFSILSSKMIEQSFSAIDGRKANSKEIHRYEKT
jgi:hypothetical protein